MNVKRIIWQAWAFLAWYFGLLKTEITNWWSPWLPVKKYTFIHQNTFIQQNSLIFQNNFIHQNSFRVGLQHIFKQKWLLDKLSHKLSISDSWECLSFWSAIHWKACGSYPYNRKSSLKIIFASLVTKMRVTKISGSPVNINQPIQLMSWQLPIVGEMELEDWAATPLFLQWHLVQDVSQAGDNVLGVLSKRLNLADDVVVGARGQRRWMGTECQSCEKYQLR